MSDATRILQKISQGDAQAANELLPVVYDELRRLAASKLALEKPGQTLQATALVHEAYLRLVGSEDPGWENRRHFFAAAAEAMRRILVENARRKNALKRGGDRERMELDSDDVPIEQPIEDVLILDELLTTLTAEHPDIAELVRLRLFAGLSNSEVATVLGKSARTVRRDWSFARAWFSRALGSNFLDK